jgi:hypothetical protein
MMRDGSSQRNAKLREKIASHLWRIVDLSE